MARLVPQRLAQAGLGGGEVVAFLQHVGLPLRPEVVVVGTSINDYEPTPMYSQTGVLVRRELGDRTPGLLDRSELVMLLRWLIAYWQGQLWYQQTAWLETGAERARESGMLASRREQLDGLVRASHLAFYRYPRASLWNRVRGAYARFGHLAKMYGIRLIVVIFPEGYQMSGDPADQLPQGRLLAACREARIDCIDLLPAFLAAGGDLFCDTQHPNARGHAVAAARIAEAIEQRDTGTTAPAGGSLRVDGRPAS